MPSFKEKIQLEDVKGIRLSSNKLALWCWIDDREVCIPQSQIDDDSEVWQPGHSGTLIVSEWIALQKELI